MPLRIPRARSMLNQIAIRQQNRILGGICNNLGAIPREYVRAIDEWNYPTEAFGLALCAKRTLREIEALQCCILRWV
jgi:hypothetical protein